MTNAEKYNLDKNKFIQSCDFNPTCDGCLCFEYCSKHFREGMTCPECAKEWLESEIKEDETN